MDRKSTLIGGVAILSIAGILSKILGMFFRFPLSIMIGSTGIGLYSAVYPTYTMLLAVSTTGIPVAISRLVSESVTLGDEHGARRVLRVALCILALTGALLAGLLAVFAGSRAEGMQIPDAKYGFIAIAPAVLLVSVMSAFRGYMQGRGNMRPTAISQMIEQIAKVAIALPLARLMMPDVVRAATAAIAGITLSEGVAMLYTMLAYLRRRRGYLENAEGAPPSQGSNMSLVKRIVRIAIPITIGSMTVPVANFIDSQMIVSRLVAAGIEEGWALRLFGLQSGVCVSYINVPTALAMAVCVGLVPNLSALRVAGRTRELHETSILGLRMATLIGMPCSVGMALLAEPIIRLLYSSYPTEEILTAARLLSIGAFTILPFTFVQGTTGVLQGLGKQKIPMYTLVAGVVCKISLNFLLIRMPEVNIYGAPVASVVCYVVSASINLIWIIRKNGVRMDWGAVFGRPALASLGMAAVVFGLTRVLDMTMKRWTLPVVAAGAVAYIVLVFATGALRREDMASIPGGAKIERLMQKLHVWRDKA